MNKSLKPKNRLSSTYTIKWGGYTNTSIPTMQEGIPNALDLEGTQADKFGSPYKFFKLDEKKFLEK